MDNKNIVTNILYGFLNGSIQSFSNSGSWCSFLRSVGWNYKYNWPSQVLIHAQRPNSIAVASEDVWVNRLHRIIKEDSQAIALLDDSGASLKIRYVFDVQDTISPSGDIFSMWTVTDQNREWVRQCMADRFGTGNARLDSMSEKDFYSRLSKRMVAEYGKAFIDDLIGMQSLTSLAGLSISEYRKEVIDLLSKSVSFAVMSRCGMNAAMEFKTSDFDAIANFSDSDVISTIGGAVQAVTKPYLLEISRIVKKHDKQKIQYREEPNYEQLELLEGRSISDPGVGSGRTAKLDEVRSDAQAISAELEPRSLQPDAVERDSMGESSGSGEPGEGTGSTDDRGIIEPVPGSEPEDQQHGMDGAHGKPEIHRGGDRAIGDPLSVTTESAYNLDAGHFGNGLTVWDRNRTSDGDYRTVAHISEDGQNVIYYDVSVLKDPAAKARIERWAQNEAEKYQKGQEEDTAARNQTNQRKPELQGEESFSTEKTSDSSSTSKPASERTISDSDVERALCSGSGIEHGKFRIYRAFSEGRNTSELARFLKDEYGLGGRTWIFEDGTRGFFDYNWRGKDFFLRKGSESFSLSWTQAAKELKTLIEAERYLTEKEQAEYPSWLRKKKEQETRIAIIKDIRSSSVLKENGPDISGDPVFRNLGDAFCYSSGESLAEAKENLLLFLNTTAVEWSQDAQLAGPQALVGFIERIRSLPDESAEKAMPTASEVGIEVDFKTPQEQLEIIQRDESEKMPPPLSREIHFFEEENKTQSIPVPEITAASFPAAGDIVTIQGAEYYIASVSDTTVTLQDREYEIFTQEMSLPVFRTLWQRAQEEEKSAPVLEVSVETSDTAPEHTASSAATPVPEDPRQASPKTTARRGRRPTSELNYVFLEAFAPGIVDGTFDYIRFESAGFEPIYIEKIGEDVYAMAHTYVEFGDLMYDPEMTFQIDTQNRRISMLSFEQSSPPVYQTVYDSEDISRNHPNVKLQKELTGFFRTWSNNISIQGFEPVFAIQRRSSGDIEYSFTDGVPVEKPKTEITVSRETSQKKGAGAFDTSNAPSDNTETVSVTPAVLVSSEPDTSAPYEEGEHMPFDGDKDIPLPVKAPISQENRDSIPPNYHIANLHEDFGGPKARYANNVSAIRLLKTLESEGRIAAPEEQAVLARYVGWGGLADAFDDGSNHWSKEYAELKSILTEDEYRAAKESSLTAFFTPPVVIEAIYRFLHRAGFEKGNVLEPSCGVGSFFGMLPDGMQGSKLYGVELDSLSGRIAQQLYPNANILVQGYENTKLPDNFFDVSIGNVPFGNFKVFDPRYHKENFLIHDFFFAKTLDKVRPGGIIAFITSSGTLDKKDSSVREYLAQRADLLGAIRLPNTTFKRNAGTDVTADIIFLQKRSTPVIENPSWIKLDQVYENGEWGPEINSYFVENPEMILGKMQQIPGPFGPEWICVPKSGMDLSAALRTAVDQIEIEVPVSFDEVGDPGIETRECIEADPNIRNFSFALVGENQDVYFREDSQMYKVETNQTALARIRALVGLRDCVHNLISAQMDDLPDIQINQLQKELNDRYDRFQERFGLINDAGNSRAFSDDSSYYLLCSLEQLDEHRKFIGKADIFYKRTIGSHTPAESVETAKESLAVSLGERGRVDLFYMAKLCGKKREEIIDELRGIIFENPEHPGTYEPANTYLSGNIRQKLDAAKRAAEENAAYLVNVAALEKTMPEPLQAGDIGIRLGSTWVPDDVYQSFMEEIFQMSEYAKKYVRIKHNDILDSYEISDKKCDAYRVLISKTYGTGRRNAYELLQDTLNMKITQVHDTVEDPDGRVRRVLNATETFAAQEKQDLIKQEFQDWVWKDPTRRERLCKLYNDKYNAIVPPTYSGDSVIFHGMNPYITLRPHQKNAVARILYGGNTQLAHAVGAGKSATRS